MINKWVVGNTVKILANDFNHYGPEFVGKTGTVVRVAGVVISVSINGQRYAFNHNALELAGSATRESQKQNNPGMITTEEVAQYVTRMQDVFEVLRDDKVLFACATGANAQLAQAEIEHLESEIANLKTQVAEMHAATIQKPFERQKDNTDGTG